MQNSRDKAKAIMLSEANGLTPKELKEISRRIKAGESVGFSEEDVIEFSKEIEEAEESIDPGAFKFQIWGALGFVALLLLGAGYGIFLLIEWLFG